MQFQVVNLHNIVETENTYIVVLRLTEYTFRVAFAIKTWVSKKGYILILSSILMDPARFYQTSSSKY